MSSNEPQANEHTPIGQEIKMTANGPLAPAAKQRNKRRNNRKAKVVGSTLDDLAQTGVNMQIDSSAPSPTEVDIITTETEGNHSIPDITASGETHEQTISSEKREQSPVEKNNIVDPRITRIMYSIADMLELSVNPLAQIEPEYLKNSINIHIRKQNVTNSPPTTQKTVASQIDSNPGPQHNRYQRRYNADHSGVNRSNYLNARAASQIESNPGPQHNRYQSRFNADQSDVNRSNYLNARAASQIESKPGPQYNKYQSRFNTDHSGSGDRSNHLNARAASQIESNPGPRYNKYQSRFNDNHSGVARNTNFNPYNARATIPIEITSSETNQLRPFFPNNNRGYPQVRGHNNNAHVNNFDTTRNRRENGNNSSYRNNNYYNGNYRNTRDFDNNSNGFLQTNNAAREQNSARFNQAEKKKVVHYSLAKGDGVELNTCKNAWAPSCRREQKSTDNAKVPIEEMQKKIRSILNKITPENMVELTKNIIELPITTYSCLAKIIELLFQKAIDEPSFTPQYAYICSQMKDLEVMSDDCTTKKSFQQLILEKCKDTFETVSVQEKYEAHRLIEIESCGDQDLKRELESKYNENERSQRKRSVGNCRFMCELFKVNLLNVKVIEMCVSHLLKMPREEPLECLCNILKHVGSRLNPENTFEKLQDLTSINYKPKISSRIRFMILDTIDLKNSNWVPRNSVIKPKTLKEIENEFSTASSDSQTVSGFNPKSETDVNVIKNVQRAISEPKENSLLVETEVETCSCLNEIELRPLRADGKGSSLYVLFKKQLAERGQQILQMRSSEHNLESQNTTNNSNTLIGELFKKKLVPPNGMPKKLVPLMVEFVKNLTNRTSNAFREILCHLPKIIGGEIARPYNLKSTMKRLVTIAENDDEGLISPLCKARLRI